MACELIACDPESEDVQYVMPGWGCCKCRTYNGLQRKECKRCGHECCHPNKPLPEKLGLCNICGIPMSGKYRRLDGGPVKHIGHTVQEGSGLKQ